MAQKRAGEKELEEMNALIEPACRQEWEISNGLRRVNLRRKPGGPQPLWRFNEKNGKLIRDNKGGIDWYRYWKEILVPKLLPFAQEREVFRPGMIVQEDNAGPHAHRYQAGVYQLHKVKKLPWPGNSPDLNAIEKAWPWLKRKTTWNSPAVSRKNMTINWKKEWGYLSLPQVRKWIEGVHSNIQEVLRLEGGNEYREGRAAFIRNYQGRRTVGKLCTHSYLPTTEIDEAENEYIDTDGDDE